MKNKIESSRNNYKRERHTSGSSDELKRDKYVKKNVYDDRHGHKRQHKSESKKRKHSSEESCSYSSDNGSDEESTSINKKYINKKDKNIKNELVFGMKIKDEPMTDDERCQRNSNQSSINKKHNEDDSRRRKRSRSKSWDNERHIRNQRFGALPVKQERFSNDNNDKRPVKKERFSDIEKEPRWGKQNDERTAGQDKKKPMVDKAKPDFGLSGKLAEETNTYNGVVIKYSEPPEARKPKRRWRLYPFKGDEGLPTLYIHRQSAFLIGRDRKVADLPVDHPSCSKQHAVLQYRLVPFDRSDGTSGKRICPYIIDLESANGTYVNNVKIEPKKYVELFEKDVLKFAYSSREYVLLHEHSKDSEDDDDM